MAFLLITLSYIRYVSVYMKAIKFYLATVADKVLTGVVFEHLLSVSI